jgi:hypothetical protein
MEISPSLMTNPRYSISSCWEHTFLQSKEEVVGLEAFEDFVGALVVFFKGLGEK